ncbi:hypothetical protein K7432_015379 [Basidiobolus ranarum]|uniref:NADPH-dependent FMN reductase-like domain-containing protein n=1 Tax=Basidiobolus ranarum TaxID=34480 RepID=A0ABR2VN59_9FUNG
MSKIGIIIGSTRPNRIGGQIASWVLDIVSDIPDMSFELVDLAEWNLPLLNEPGIAAKDEYVHEHTRAWSKQINSEDAYIFITPQYNWGYPAALKNAIDYLYKEWNGKPAVIISYAHRGGGRAAAQLRQVLEGVRMLPATTMPAIAFNDAMLTETGALRDPHDSFSQYVDVIKDSLKELVDLLKKRES